MKLSPRHLALAGVIAFTLMACAAGAVYAGVLDPAHILAGISAAPMILPFGMTANVPTAKLLRGAQEARAAMVDKLQAITASVTDGTALSAEQQKQIDDGLALIAGLDGDIKRLSAMVNLDRGAITVPGATLETHPNVLDDPKRGFKSLGDFAQAVRVASIRPQAADERLTIIAGAATTFSNENVGTDGGYLVPTEFARDIAKISLDSDAFLPMTDQMPISGNSITFPSDETTPWGTNGARTYWASEAGVATQTKPIIKPNTMRLNKLLGLVPVTDELLEDAPAISAYLTGLLGRSVKWKVNDAIINGTGAGQPMGILNSPALVTIVKEGGQATLTLQAMNLAKMYAAMPVDYLRDAVWLITPDALPSLITLTLGNFAIWTPPTVGFANAPGGFLFGKPIILTQTAKAFSSAGDVMFVNFKAYRTISKDGIEIAESMHLYFDADQTAYRATFRVDGQPTFKAAIVQARGTQPLSPYVALGAR